MGEKWEEKSILDGGNLMRKSTEAKNITARLEKPCAAKAEIV